jgi:hypothetical protein
MNAVQVGGLILANYPQLDGLVDFVGDYEINGKIFQSLTDDTLKGIAPLLTAKNRQLILKLQWKNLPDPVVFFSLISLISIGSFAQGRAAN